MSIKGNNYCFLVTFKKLIPAATKKIQTGRKFVKEFQLHLPGYSHTGKSSGEFNQRNFLKTYRTVQISPLGSGSIPWNEILLLMRPLLNNIINSAHFVSPQLFE